MLINMLLFIVQLSQVEQVIAAAGQTEELQKLVTDLKELISLTEGIIVSRIISTVYYAPHFLVILRNCRPNYWKTLLASCALLYPRVEKYITLIYSPKFVKCFVKKKRCYVSPCIPCHVQAVFCH